MEEENRVREEERNSNKKSHKGIKRSAIAIALAALIAAGGSFVKTLPNSIEGSLTDVVNNNKEQTLFDDVLELDETIKIMNENGELEEVQVEDAIKILEEKSQLIQKIKELKINSEGLNELSDEAKKNTINYLNENGIDEIIELYKDDKNSKIEKARIAQQLIYIENQNKKWFEENGIPVSKSILTRVISSGTIQSYGTFKPEEYNVVSIDTTKNGFIKTVELNDSISGVKDNITFLPIISDEYYKAYDLLSKISSDKQYDTEKITEIVNDTLNISKRCISKELVNSKGFTYTKKLEKNDKE